MPEFYGTGKELRSACREGRFTQPTTGVAVGCVQANLVVLPSDWAMDFMLFAQRNPKPCPLLEVGEVGSPITRVLADDADIRMDIPRYRIYQNGEMVDEVLDIKDAWRDDFVYFLLGCSFTFEQALLAAGLEVRHITEGVNVPMYKTSILCRSAGRFEDVPMVVSMRPYKAADAIRAVEVTRDYPAVHGSPLHLGDPGQIGIANIDKPDWGDRVTIREHEMPVFWACGVTPQMAAMVARPPVMITHAPGHMFVGDRKDCDYKL